MLFSKENKFPRSLFEAREVAGSATYEQNKNFVHFVWPGINHQPMKLFLFWLKQFP